MRTRRYLILTTLALLCVIGWTVYGQQRNSRRPTWEYKSVYDRDGRFHGEQTFNELGAQGWELVTAATSSDIVGVTYTFRRSK